MKNLILSIIFLQFSLISRSQDATKEIFDRAVEYKKHGKYQEALSEYDKVLILKPKFVNALINRANVKSLLNNNNGAIADLNEAEKIDPSEPEIYYNRGNAENDIKLYKEAIVDFDKAISLSSHEDYYLARGNSKKAIGLYEEAIKDYSQAISIKSNFTDAYYNRANAKQKFSDFIGAIEDYDKAIKIEPTKIESYMNRGNAKIRLQKYQEAIMDFDLYIKMNPANYLAYSNRGIANGGLKNNEKAINDYSRAIEINPNSADSYFGRAGIKHSTGDKVGECSDLKKAADLGYERAKNIYDKNCK